MVHAATNQYGLFLQIAQTWGGFTCVEYMATSTLNQTLVLMCGCCHARHALHHIEHGALNLQQAQLLAIHAKSNIAWLYVCAVHNELLHAALRVEVRNDLFGNFNTSDDTFFFYNQLLATHLCFWNATQ